MHKVFKEQFTVNGHPVNPFGYVEKKLRIMKIIIPLFLVMFFSIFFFVGTFVSNVQKKAKKICTEPVNAIVCDMARSTSSDSTTYAPIYEFEYNGMTYKIQSNTYSSPMPLQVGDNVQIFVEPGNPDRIYSPHEKATTMVGRVFQIIGGIGMLIPLIIIIVTLARSGRKKTAFNHSSNMPDEFTDGVSTFEETSECVDEVSVYDETDGYQ